jgi:2,4-dienoyl-CoA reductase-like NADH-dependent reductase (Old Yellow Enzyme family)/thioredoxin reductase
MKVTPFTPLKIGPVELPNRLAMAPVKTAFGGLDGLADPQHVAYYRRRAAGGVGLIIVEPLCVDPKGREHPRQLAAFRDGAVGHLSRVVGAIHGHESLAFAHLNHAGRAANPKAIGGVPEAPSAVVCPTTGATPEPMTTERVSAVLEAYRKAAGRVREAGFDGLELQLGLGYLPAQFLSARTNLRSDEYGHHGEGRWRFVRELVERVRAAIGDGMALMARISADEKVAYGLGLGDAIELAARLESWGVHAIHVVTGSACDSPPWYYQHMALPDGVNESLAARIRNSVSIPVVVAGRLGDPDRMRDVLGKGMADVVALGRPIVADPDLPRKIREGREEEIVFCGACLQGCLAKVKSGGPIGCIVNPGLGREADWPPSAIAADRHLVVVGGGPAGMEAALEADRVGFAVTLLERNDVLGGQFALAPLTTGKEAMIGPLCSLINAVRRSGADIRCGFEATVDAIVDLEPDHVVVATGSRPAKPPIPGLEAPLTAGQVLAGDGDVGHRVLILGGGLVGIEMAEHLGRAGHEIVVVELLEEIARDMETITRKMTLDRLEMLPVTIHTKTRLVRMIGQEAIVSGARNGAEKSIGQFDSVLVAIGHEPCDALSKKLRAAGLPVTVIGDAREPRQIFDATQEGRDVIEEILRANSATLIGAVDTIASTGVDGGSRGNDNESEQGMRRSHELSTGTQS